MHLQPNSNLLRRVTVASYAANKTNDFVIKEIEHFCKVLFQWSDFNYTEINGEKSRTLVSGNGSVSVNVGNNSIISESKIEL